MKSKLLIFSFLPLFCKAQNYNDSLFFMTVFQQPVYQNPYNSPGTWYLHPCFTSRKQLFDSLNNLMKFSSDEYFGSYENIILGEFKAVDSINETMNYYYNLNHSYAYRQTDPIFELSFSLDRKKSKTYCTFTQTTFSDAENKTAILFITGSDPNNGTKMVRGEGYQNIYGYQRDSLRTIGDVFIAIRPLNDFRNFVWDNNGKPKALESEFPIPNQLTNYLNARGTPYGVQSLIESIALVKWLKSKYKRVIIAGLSFGGIYTTLNAFESNPDACLVSGGYTITIDEPIAAATANLQGVFFGTLLYSLMRDSVKASLTKSSTKYLFSWGKWGDIQAETDWHYTENYFKGLSNVQYFYDYQKHTFPPLIAFKNLIETTLK